jgi:uncharacterized damage-inducible protein DinB
MQIADVRVLFDHLYWMRDRIVAAAETAPAAWLDPTSVTIRDLRATMVHELDVEWSWRRRLDQPGPPRPFPPDDLELRPEDFSTLGSLVQRWSVDEAAMRSWLAGLTDRDLAGAWQLGESAGLPLWQHLMHIYTHGVLQFADAAVLLTRAAASPGELDFLDFVESTSAQ